MGKIGFLFAGQGAQKVGMGKDLYENVNTVRKIYEIAEEKMQGIQKLCFEGPLEELNKTINTQPCIFITNVAIWEVMKENGIVPDIIGGFSLGELSALVCSGALTIEKGLEIVKVRGELMQEASNTVASSLIAVMGLKDVDVENLSKKVKDAYPVNYNCPGQVVVAVGEESVDEFINEVKAFKGKAMKLPVSGGFHSPYMNEAAKKFGDFVSNDDFSSINIPVYSNFLGELYQDSIATNLVSQINNPVRWSLIIEDMLKNGVDTFVEIGPGTTLSGFVKKTKDHISKNTEIDLSHVKILNVQDEESLKNAIEVIKGE